MMPGTQRFVFDATNSEMASAELDTQFGDGVQITSNEFLKYNYRELAQLAINGSPKKKDWLNSYLKTCEDDVEKQALLEAFNSPRKD